jgi:hypothetical protein
VLRNLIQWLDERFPQLSPWVRDRLGIDMPAFLASTAVHLVLLLTLAMVGFAAHTREQTEFQGAVDTSVAEPLGHAEYDDLDQTEAPSASTPAAGSFSPNLAPMTVVASSASAAGPQGMSADLGTGPAMRPTLPSLEARQITDVASTTASIYGQNVSIKGSGIEHAGGVEGAVDRIADEILRRLEKGRTLVVWAFDASGSLQAERERLSKRIAAVYAHIDQRDSESRADDGGLLTGIVAFGHDFKLMTPHPTADKSEITAAISSVPLDTTGDEFTFSTVAQIVQKWGAYRDAKGNRYHCMVIVVTDEIGDDDSQLELAVGKAVKANVPVFILGSQALFGRVEGLMPNPDPKTRGLYPMLPVKQGPESVVIEQIRLPFWYSGFQYDNLNSGFGPWALSRLANATGGIYFITRMGENRMGFDPAQMREYKPDWVSRDKYEADVLRNPFRSAIINAALITQQRLPGTPPLNFGFPSDAPEFKDAMRDGQVVAERTEYTVNEALVPISERSVIKAREHEKSRRWQANYDLTRGRLLAMKVRCNEYNWACAKMKRDPLKFTKAGSNSWRLVPDPEVKASDKAAAAASEATKLLERVIKEHPGTPWALFAQREIKDPFGFKWVETTVRPVVRNNNAADAPAKKAKPMPAVKPPDPPKL